MKTEYQIIINEEKGCFEIYKNGNKTDDFEHLFKKHNKEIRVYSSAVNKIWQKEKGKDKDGYPVYWRTFSFRLIDTTIECSLKWKFWLGKRKIKPNKPLRLRFLQTLTGIHVWIKEGHELLIEKGLAE